MSTILFLVLGWARNLPSIIYGIFDRHPLGWAVYVHTVPVHVNAVVACTCIILLTIAIKRRSVQVRKVERRHEFSALVPWMSSSLPVFFGNPRLSASIHRFPVPSPGSSSTDEFAGHSVNECDVSRPVWCFQCKQFVIFLCLQISHFLEHICRALFIPWLQICKYLHTSNGMHAVKFKQSRLIVWNMLKSHTYLLLCTGSFASLFFGRLTHLDCYANLLSYSIILLYMVLNVFYIIIFRF